jgi:SpoVK/Ycf46/Vps4 family AAA+-type ATPase
MHKIQSKWVGESEKNIAKIFDEYRAFSKTVDRTPILVFNEADAIFSKRINVVSSVDQMNNSLQNILLEILENFEGIFFATSNLIQNLDSAFDRRLLYKIEFQKPEEETRLNILLTNFETISQDLLIGINKEFCLTGGQIINVKKKFSISTLLNMGTDENELLYNLCKDEISFQKSSLREIGFRLNKCK